MEDLLLQEEQTSEQVMEPRPIGCFYLRFDSEEQFLAACEEAGFIKEYPSEWDVSVDEEGVETRTPVAFEKIFTKECIDYNFDVIGTIWSQGAYEMDETTGEMVTVHVTRGL